MTESLYEQMVRDWYREQAEWRREIDARNARWDREAENRAWNNNSSI